VKPKVQRTYSDPDLPELLPLPVRPASSYEPRPKVKEHPQFSHDAVEGMAKKLGLDIELHPDFRWVIRDCLLALRDENYMVRVRGEDVEYIYKYTDEARSYHPIVEAHRKLVESLLMVQENLKMKRLDEHYRIKHLVYLAIMGEKDVRGVTNERLIEELMDLLDVNPLDEPYLVPRVKCSVEDCYFRMKEIGPENITIDNCIDIESLIINLELDRVGFMKKISPSGLLYCVENQTQLADVISTGSHDVFCYSSAVEVHSTGNRQDMPLVFFEQVVCAECEVKAADVRDQDDMENYCYDCFKKTHTRGKRQRHCVSLPYRTFCAEFPENEASYICLETGEVLSTKAVARMRKSAARQNFTLYGLRKAAYCKKLFADNLDRLMNILQNHVERQYPLSPWFIFYDKAKAPYWYNFQTHAKYPADINDLINPPKPEAEEGEEQEADADEQFLSNEAGAGNLRDTHAARFASQGAIFDVPPPVHVKFALPMK